MHDIEAQHVPESFAERWRTAALHLQARAPEGGLRWLRGELGPLLLEHLSFALGNQVFFVRIEDEDGLLDAPGHRNGLLKVADACRGHACLMPMRRGVTGWRPEATVWGLLELRTGRAIDPPACVTAEPIEMTDWELHDCAVQVVRERLAEAGRALMSWQSDPGVDPAIWFVGDAGPEWVVVRAVRQPHKDAPPPPGLADIARHCARLSDVGHFASVGFASAADPFDPLCATNGNFIPVLGGGEELAVRYLGLQRVTPTMWARH